MFATITVKLTIGPPGFEPGNARVFGSCSCKAWEVMRVEVGEKLKAGKAALGVGFAPQDGYRAEKPPA
jgi:hypothetical protein